MIILNTLTPIVIVSSVIQSTLESLIIIVVTLIINSWIRMELKCPSCGYKIDRSRLGPIALFPDKTCRCGQDKRKDEAESSDIRLERIRSEKIRGW